MLCKTWAVVPGVVAWASGGPVGFRPLPFIEAARVGSAHLTGIKRHIGMFEKMHRISRRPQGSGVLP